MTTDNKRGFIYYNISEYLENDPTIMIDDEQYETYLRKYEDSKAERGNNDE